MNHSKSGHVRISDCHCNKLFSNYSAALQLINTDVVIAKPQRRPKYGLLLHLLEKKLPALLNQKTSSTVSSQKTSSTVARRTNPPRVPAKVSTLHKDDNDSKSDQNESTHNRGVTVGLQAS